MEVYEEPKLVLKKVRYIEPPVASAFDEFWTEIPLNSKSTYYISTYGRIYSVKRGRLLKKEVYGHPSFEWTQQDNMPQVIPYRNNATGKAKKRQTTVGRMVAATYIKQTTPAHNIVVHLNHNKKDNRVENLRWVMPPDAVKTIRKAKDWIQPSRAGSGWKLEREQVVEMRELLHGGATVREMAKKYQISEMTVYRIRTGELWQVAGGPIEPKMQPVITELLIVKKIKELLAEGELNGKQIAKKLNVGAATVSRIKRGVYHKNVTI